MCSPCTKWQTVKVGHRVKFHRTPCWLGTVVGTYFKFEYHHVSDNYRFPMVFHNTGVFPIPSVFHSKYIEMFRYFSGTLYTRMYIQDTVRVSLLGYRLYYNYIFDNILRISWVSSFKQIQ